MEAAAGGEGDRLFFLVGRARSGTSWARRMLNAHPQVLCSGEGRFFGRDYVLGDTGVRSLHGALLESRELRAWARRSSWARERPFEGQAERFTAAIVGELMVSAMRSEGAELAGDKTPTHGTDTVADIHRLFPRARIVHVVRDGRDVAVSLRHWDWSRPLEGGGVHRLTDSERATRDAYATDPGAFGAQGRSIFEAPWLRRVAGERYLELRYEALLERPRRHLAEIFDFLGVPADGPTLRRCVRGKRFDRRAGREPGEEDAQAKLRKGVAGDWRAVFTPQDREVFREAAGDALLELGYEEGREW
jgi:hypothetical protein